MTKADGGAVLLLALFSMSLISFLSVAFLDITTIEQQITTNQIRETQAIQIAEAGIEQKIYEICYLSQNVWSKKLVDEFPKNSGHKYTVTVDAGAFPLIVLTSAGKIGSFQKTVEAGVRIKGLPLSYSAAIDYWKEP